MCICFLFVFFFKQKTAYEMRISDWSSDVCSSDLAPTPGAAIPGAECLVRINATPQSWLIQGYDPFEGAVPAGPFGVTSVNEGTGECRFTPTFELRQPPFCLPTGRGTRNGYARPNLTDTNEAPPPHRPPQPKK